MKIIVCDLDGSLMPPSSGVYVSEAVKNKIIEIQKKGILVILNSARIFQGIEPLSRQLKMDEFGGYIIDSNGAHAYDVKKKTTILSHALSKEMVDSIWTIVKKYGLNVGYSQPDCFVADGMSEGFILDQKNCEVKYVIQNKPSIKDEVYKCSASGTIEQVNQFYPVLKEEIESLYPVRVLHNAPSMMDIIHKESSKAKTVEDILNMLNRTWNDVSAIGDGNSDVPVLEKSQFPVTLENGCSKAKRCAKLICPSCYEDGCLVWLEKINESY